MKPILKSRQGYARQRTLKPDARYVQAVLAPLPWYHQLALLDKLPDPVTCRWYAAKAIEHNWSRNILVMQIDTRLRERSGMEGTNFDARLPSPPSDLARGSLKDPYRFDFLGLTDAAQDERGLAGDALFTEDDSH
jgi:hypothetical protein